MQVSTAVEHYFALTEASNTKWFKYLIYIPSSHSIQIILIRPFLVLFIDDSPTYESLGKQSYQAKSIDDNRY